MPSLGPTELIIILVIVMLVFGAGKLTEVGKSLGQGIKEFRHSVQDESQPAAPPPVPAAPVSTAPTASAPGPAAATTTATKCTKCGADVQADARFCPACGQPVTS
jgi:sec-independent protein translocase protein TatA